MATTLTDVTKQLKTNDNTQEETVSSIVELNKTFQNYFTTLERNKLDELEFQQRFLKAIENLQAPPREPVREVREEESRGFPFALAIPPLSLLKLPALVALAAEIGDFDAYIKALRIPAWLSTFKRSIDTIVDTFNSIGRFVDNNLSKLKLPDIPKFVWLDEAGNIIDDVKLRIPTFPVIRFIDDAGQAISNFIDYKIRLPIINLVDDTGRAISDIIDYRFRLPAINFIDDAGQAISNFIDYKIKLPAINFIDDAGQAISNFIDYKIKLPAINFIDEAGNLLDKFTVKFPTLPSINFVDDAGRVVDNIVDAFKIRLPTIPSLGFVNEAGEAIKIADYISDITIPTGIFDSVRAFFVGTETGGGVLGMFTKIADLVTSIPGLKTIFRVIGGPVTQALLSIFDFFRGFYEGFTETEIDPETGEEIQRDFADRVLSGLEGGVVGVIKGITEAFDLLFIRLPAWLLEKLGAENAAEFLRGFSLTELVDPIWNGIKGIFNFFTNAEYRAEKIAEFKSMFNETIEEFKNWFKDLFDFLPSIEDIKQALYNLMPSWLRSSDDDERRENIEEELERLRELEANTPSQDDDPDGMRAMSGLPYKEDYAAQIRALEQELSDINQRSFRRGTQGQFIDFGQGTPATLHGREAIVPQQSNEGRILAASRSQVVADTLTELATSDRGARGNIPGINNVLTDARQTTVVSSSSARINVTPESYNSAWMMRRGIIPYR